MLTSGRKHIWALVSSSTNLDYQIEMMLAVAGSAEALSRRPICHGIVTVLEQLTFPEDEIEKLREDRRHTEDSSKRADLSERLSRAESELQEATDEILDELAPGIAGPATG